MKTILTKPTLAERLSEYQRRVTNAAKRKYLNFCLDNVIADARVHEQNAALARSAAQALRVEIALLTD